MYESLILLLKGKTLFTAESCTAGLIAASLADVPGASAVLLGGVVCYDNALKVKLLAVNPQTLEGKGAVSFECCEEMLKGALKLSGADYACAATGIAGPGGGTPSKPVGTVFIGAINGKGGVMARLLLPGGRAEVRRESSLAAATMAYCLGKGQEFAHPSMEEKKIF